MTTLTRASNELFRRAPDERLPDLDTLMRLCQRMKEEAADLWQAPSAIRPESDGSTITLHLGEDGVYRMNNWSFSQVCRLAEVSKDTVNKLSPNLAASVLRETMPMGAKPFQLLAHRGLVRAVHGPSYTRLYHADLLRAVQEEATGFEPPQSGMNGGTGLYCGEEDMFCFLIDPMGWVDIDGEAFAPGMFLWNSEVGRRTVGVQTFWFQAICQNHIVWDAVDVVEYTRKHTANVRDALEDIRRIVHNIAHKRDERRDGFYRVVKKAMGMSVGKDEEEAMKALARHGFQRGLARQAVEMAGRTGKLTLFSMVDALTRLSGQLAYAGDRTEADEKAGQLLYLAA